MRCTQQGRAMTMGEMVLILQGVTMCSEGWRFGGYVAEFSSVPPALTDLIWANERVQKV